MQLTVTGKVNKWNAPTSLLSKVQLEALDSFIMSPYEIKLHVKLISCEIGMFFLQFIYSST